MPIYCYQTEDLKIVEREFPMGEAPRTIQMDDGTTARRNYAAECYSRAFVPTSKNWPLECIASGVHADQANELRDFLNKAGVPTEVSRDGNPIYRSMEHRRRALKARGMFDRNSFV